jgi:hypothetical protein
MPIIPLSLPFHNIIIYYYYYYYYSIEQQVEFVASTYSCLWPYLNKGCVSHISLAILHYNSILRQKKNYGNSNISPHKKIYNLQKKPSTRNQNPSKYHNSIITNLKFQHKAKKLSSFKNPHIEIDLLLLPRGQNPLSYYTL